jgi:hypothetical protein
MSENYMGILLEDIKSQNQTILEAVGAMQIHVAKIPKMEADLQEVKSDVKSIRAAITDNSRAQHKLERRVTKLEAAV